MKQIITFLILTYSFLNCFSQSKKFSDALKTSVLQKKPLLVVVKYDNRNVGYEVAVSPDGQSDVLERERLEKLVKLETDINNDILLKDTQVSRILKENYIVYRMSADSLEYDRLLKKYKVEYKNIPEYWVISSRGYLLSDAILGKYLDNYNVRSIASRLKDAAKTNKMIEDVYKRFGPKATKDDYKAISFYLNEIPRPISIDIAKKFFQGASEKQLTDSLLYRNFSFLNEGEINSIDSFYISNYKRLANKIPYNHYRYFFFLFARKYNAMYNRMPDNRGKFFNQFISLKPLMDTCINYYPLALPISHERFELNSGTKMWKPIASSACINALLHDVDAYLNFNTDSVCELFKQRTNGLYSDKECLWNESDYLYSYSRGLSADISTLKYYVAQRKVEEPDKITTQSLSDIGEKIAEREKKLRDQLRQSLK